MPSRETGAWWELMNHISIIEKKHWKRKSDIRKHWNLRQRVICLGADTAFCWCRQSLLVNSVPSCPGTALWHPLWHQDKGTAFNTVLSEHNSSCQPCIKLPTFPPQPEERTTETESRPTDREAKTEGCSDIKSCCWLQMTKKLFSLFLIDRLHTKRWTFGDWLNTSSLTDPLSLLS